MCWGNFGSMCPDWNPKRNRRGSKDDGQKRPCWSIICANNTRSQQAKSGQVDLKLKSSDKENATSLSKTPSLILDLPSTTVLTIGNNDEPTLSSPIPSNYFEWGNNSNKKNKVSSGKLACSTEKESKDTPRQGKLITKTLPMNKDNAKPSVESKDTDINKKGTLKEKVKNLVNKTVVKVSKQ